jgi:hypothetical protein
LSVRFLTDRGYERTTPSEHTRSQVLRLGQDGLGTGKAYGVKDDESSSEPLEDLATRLQLEHPEWTIDEVEAAVERQTGRRPSSGERPGGER